MSGAVTILPCGDRALSVELSRELDEGVNRRVIALAANIEADPIDGVVETVPTYRALLVHYDPLRVGGADLARDLRRRLDAVPTAAPGAEGRLWRLPVVYGGDMALDLDLLAEMKGLSTDEIVRLHSGAEYRVYMIGFAPGFAYLGGVPEVLHTPRRTEPRQWVGPGSVGIGGQQGSISSVGGPSGWRFIGGTPVRTFDPARADPFLLRAGDRVRFEPVSVAEGARIADALDRGDMVLSPEPGPEPGPKSGGGHDA